MKINAFVEDLKTKSAAELNEELVAAKKELFNPEIPERDQSVRQHQQNQRSEKKYCQNSDHHH